MISSEQAYKLVSFGVLKVPIINDAVDEVEGLAELNDRQLAVVVICYAASLARLTQLNLHDFLGLSGAAYQNVEISKKDALHSDGSRSGDPSPTGDGHSTSLPVDADGGVPTPADVDKRGSDG